MRVDNFVHQLNSFKTTLLNHPLSNEISPLSDHPNYSTKTLSQKNIGVSDGNSQQMIHLIESLQAIVSVNESQVSVEESLQEFNQKIEIFQNQIDELFKDNEFISKRFKPLFEELSQLVTSMERLNSSEGTKFFLSSTYQSKIRKIESICSEVIRYINTWMNHNIFGPAEETYSWLETQKGTNSPEKRFSDMAIFQSHRFDDASDRDYFGSALEQFLSDDNIKGNKPRLRERSDWDMFRSDNRGLGLSRADMSKSYQAQKKGVSIDDSLHHLSSIRSLNFEGEISYADPGDLQFENINKVSSKVPSRSRQLPSGTHEAHQMAVFSSDEPEFEVNLWNRLNYQVLNSDMISEKGKYYFRALYDDLFETRSNSNDVDSDRDPELKRDEIVPIIEHTINNNGSQNTPEDLQVQTQLTFDGAIINIYDHMKKLTLSRKDRAEFFKVILRLVKEWGEFEESVVKATLIEKIVKSETPSSRQDESFNQFLEKSPFALVSDIYVQGLSKIADDVRHYLLKFNFDNLENQMKSDFIQKFCSRDHRGIVMVYRTDFKQDSLKSAILDSLKDRIRLNDPKNLEMIIPELNDLSFPSLVRLYLKEGPITLGGM